MKPTTTTPSGWWEPPAPATSASSRPKALTATTEATATEDDLRTGRCTPGQMEDVIRFLNSRSDNLDNLAEARARWSGQSRGVLRSIITGHAERLLNMSAVEQQDFVRDQYRIVRRSTRGPDPRIVRAALRSLKRSL